MKMIDADKHTWQFFESSQDGSSLSTTWVMPLRTGLLFRVTEEVGQPGGRNYHVAASMQFAPMNKDQQELFFLDVADQQQAA